MDRGECKVKNKTIHIFSLFSPPFHPLCRTTLPTALSGISPKGAILTIAAGFADNSLHPKALPAHKVQPGQEAGAEEQQARQDHRGTKDRLGRRAYPARRGMLPQ